MSISETRTGPAEHILLELFHQNIDRILDDLDAQQDLDVVVGIPFHTESDTLGDVITTARAGIRKLGLGGKAVVLCAGPERSRPVFESVVGEVGDDPEVPLHGLFMENGLDGRGWNLRALMVTATRYRAPLILLPPNLSRPRRCSSLRHSIMPEFMPSNR